MNRIKGILVLGAVLTLFLLAGCAQGTTKGTYQNMTVDELNQKMANKDFFLLDVHVPEQQHIKGTDRFVSYLDVKNSADKLPANKDKTIVVYCRSGSMSVETSLDLIDMGYTNVYNVQGGANAWKAAGYPME